MLGLIRYQFRVHPLGVVLVVVNALFVAAVAIGVPWLVGGLVADLPAAAAGGPLGKAWPTGRWTAPDATDLASTGNRSGATDVIADLTSGWDTVLEATYPGGHDVNGGRIVEPRRLDEKHCAASDFM